jgi:hypothetical protein
VSGSLGSSPPDKPSRTLTDVIADLDVIIGRARDERSELGIFPAMYRTVTSGVRQAVDAGFFDHNDAMEELSIVFADRYLGAYEVMDRGIRPTEAWHVAFAAATDGKRRMVVQHLLAGMTAHINLDLGIATAAVAGERPEAMYVDFFRVNQMLFEQVDVFQAMLNSVSSRMAWIDRIGGSLDERLTETAIGGARERAWYLAIDLLENSDRADAIISARDHETAHVGRLVLEGVLRVRTVSRIIAMTEPSDVRKVIDAFVEPSVDLDAIEEAVQAADTTPPPSRSRGH